MTAEQVNAPRKYKKKKRVAILANFDDATKQCIIDFMSEFLCDQILSGRLKLNESKDEGIE